MSAVERLNSQAQVIEVDPAGARCAASRPGLLGRHNVDQRVAGTKLGQFALSLFKPQAQRIEVEPLERPRIGRAQDEELLIPENQKYETPLLPGFELDVARPLAYADRWAKKKRQRKPPGASD